MQAIKVTMYRSPMTMQTELSIKGLREEDILKLASALVEIGQESGQEVPLDFLNGVIRTPVARKLDL